MRVAPRTNAIDNSNLNASHLNIENNLILGGKDGGMFYGIILNGSIAKPDLSNKLINNSIENFYSDGISIYNQDFLEVTGNVISRPFINRGDLVYGIYIIGENKWFRFRKKLNSYLTRW